MEVGRADLANFDLACGREWLVTNGLGGFASGTVGDANTRRYHGVLVAALSPPLGRTLTVAKLDVEVHYCERAYYLASNEFVGGSIDPHGYQHIERFRLENGLPVWEYAFADAVLEKRLIMPHGENTTLVQLRVLRASAPIRITVRPLCTYRDYHSHTQGGWEFAWDLLDDGFHIRAFDGAQHYQVRVKDGAAVIAAPEWYWRFRHRVEADRGLDESEDLFGPGLLCSELDAGEAMTLVVSTESAPSDDFVKVLAAEDLRREALLECFGEEEAPGWVKQMVIAADQFVVTRRTLDTADGRTVIAGYPWFGDWGRDTMIALPGLTLTTGRFDVARDILKTFAEHIDQGMLPNRFPDNGKQPEYNTSDATLWYVHAIREYTVRSGDLELANSLFDTLIDIVEWHRRGTRYNIHVDPADGLLVSGEEGVQLTWMDAKVGDWVVTPRTGKAVEINALWHNALLCIADLASRMGKAKIATSFQQQAGVVRQNFQRFWSEKLGFLHDVIDGPEGEVGSDGKRYDSSLRPNQIFAVSLPFSPLNKDRQRAVVDACARELTTSYGLRSLAATESQYVGHYGGGPLDRDGSYHQGTVWAWLLAPFAESHFRVYGNAEQARSFLQPLRVHLREACLGSISEIFDADPPHSARGCFAQAWSVSETLRVWIKLGANLDDEADGEIAG